ncbi:RNA polymerase sigma factor [Streptomyces sp. AC627_RSS907]|uniref:RNA polymerase sigma factor n=1 Tax=Streptomyces sp. AC627_RSS907 TaxID=2823684 RepID=UPI0020B652F7|nr:sigma factor-like helix-turn-helix DNA-binding protein [Streptomyces sp. AC627_RSS907]
MNGKSALVVRIQQAEASMTIDDGTDRVDDRLALVDAWQSLPQADQEVLSLSVWEELSAAEAAQVLGCTRAAYSMRLTRAKRRVPEALAAHRHDDRTAVALAH